MNSLSTEPGPRLSHVRVMRASGLHRFAYWEWGDPRNTRVVVCVHGLSRQSRDFDALASALADQYRVVCPDVVGRGQSDWLADPMGYQVPFYVADMVTLLARLDVERVDWVGTSMGGLIGMGLASLLPSPIRRLVLNDIGPTIESSSLVRIGSYLGLPMRWPTIDEAADYLLGISKGFGPHTREQWLALTKPMLVADDTASGPGWKLHYDPAIAAPFRAATPEMASAGEAMAWAAYDAIRAPTLLIRGAESDLLSPATAHAMTQRGPNATLRELPGVGHAPTLLAAEQIAIVREFLLAP